MNYSAKASSKHLLNRVGSRPKINYSRFNLKDKKNIKDTSLSFVTYSKKQTNLSNWESEFFLKNWKS